MAASALKNLRKLMAELETPEVLQGMFNRLKHEENDLASVLLYTNFLDCGLKGVLISKFPNKEAGIRLFMDHGPLQSLNAKIRLCEAFNLYDSTTRKNLEVIQMIRNSFAHSLVVESFATPEIKEACDGLIISEKMKSRETDGEYAIRFGTSKEKFTAVCILTITTMMSA